MIIQIVGIFVWHNQYMTRFLDCAATDLRYVVTYFIFLSCVSLLLLHFLIDMDNIYEQNQPKLFATIVALISL